MIIPKQPLTQYPRQWELPLQIYAQQYRHSDWTQNNGVETLCTNNLLIFSHKQTKNHTINQSLTYIF